MNVWIHSAIIATTTAAVVAVGIASASTGPGASTGTSPTAAKGDRLPVVARADDYVTVETRSDGASILMRVRAN